MCDRFKWGPWQLDDLTPEELAVARQYLQQQLEREQSGN